MLTPHFGKILERRRWSLARGRQVRESPQHCCRAETLGARKVLGLNAEMQVRPLNAKDAEGLPLLPSHDRLCKVPEPFEASAWMFSMRFLLSVNLIPELICGQKRPTWAAARLLLLAACLAATGCGTEEAAISYPPAPPELAGETVTLPSSTVVLGFTHGTLRATQAVPSFRISTYPVTREKFDTCVQAGVCSAPEAEANITANKGHSRARLMALNVGVDNARSFCAWQRARLPTIAEWLLAARGREIQRFPWGSAPARYDQHPYADARRSPIDSAHPAPSSGQRSLLTGPSCDSCPPDLLEVGTHSANAGPSGMRDALLAPRELIVGDNAAPFTQCGTSNVPCVVYGLLPGSIDFVAPPEGSVTTTYSFRCVWGSR